MSADKQTVPLRVVLDANVLYPAPLRDTLMWLAVGGVYQARWSDPLYDEWTRNVLLQRPDLGREQLERTYHRMNQALPEARVTGFEPLIAQLTLPDPEDRHVLALALYTHASRIVTFNLKDFPHSVLSQHGVLVQHPDDFVLERFEKFPTLVVDALRAQRANLQRPPRSGLELLETLEQQGLVRSVAALRAGVHSL